MTSLFTFPGCARKKAFSPRHPRLGCYAINIQATQSPETRPPLIVNTLNMSQTGYHVVPGVSQKEEKQMSRHPLDIVFHASLNIFQENQGTFFFFSGVGRNKRMGKCLPITSSISK